MSAVTAHGPYCRRSFKVRCLQVTLQGSGRVLTASAQHNSEANIAKQQTALNMVHQLQQAILMMLTTSKPDKGIPTAMQTSTDHTSSLAMTILHEGDADNSMPEIGNVVKVQYRLVRDPMGQRSLAPEGPNVVDDKPKTANPAANGELLHDPLVLYS